MHWKPALIEIVRSAWHWLMDSYLVWGAMGALIAQAYAHGELSLWRRFQQWGVGVVVMHLVVSLTLVLWPGLWRPAVHLIGFFVGFLAFAALGVWQKAAVEAGASAIRDTGAVWGHLLNDWRARLGGRRDPVNTEGEG